ncbi:hypothetical protein KSF78_0000317 [Schistosoma japonicum]|nr:hypothetical protein KSF78_0000317 [Schistosoma japonicum]
MKYYRNGTLAKMNDTFTLIDLEQYFLLFVSLTYGCQWRIFLKIEKQNGQESLETPYF